MALMIPILLGGCVKDEVGGVVIKSNTASELLCVAENSGVSRQKVWAERHCR